MAGRVALDLKQFKHIKSDDKSTTLQHADGHQLTLAHKSLSPESQKALAALGAADAKGMDKGEKKQDSKTIQADTAAEGVRKSNSAPAGTGYGNTIQLPSKDEQVKPGKVKMADGGGVGGVWDSVVKTVKSSMEETPKGPAKPVATPTQTQATDMKKVFGDTSKAEGGPVMMAEGEDPADAPAAPEIPEALKPPTQDAAPQPSTLPQPPINAPVSPQDENQKYQQVYQNIYQQQKRDNPGQPDSEAQAMALRYATSAKDNDKADAGNAVADQQAAAMAQNTQIAQQNEQRAKIGLPPLPITSMPQDTQMAAAQQTADNSQSQVAQGQKSQSQGEQQPSRGLPGMEQLAGDMYNKGTQAINEQQKVQEQQGKAEQAAEAARLKGATDSMAAFQTAGDALKAERGAHIKDIENGYVSPEKYWTGYTAANGDKVSGHSKVAAAIGMILAGFNPTNNPNAAIGILKNQIDMSLQAQAKNLDSQHNLLRANLEQFHNIRDAADMTRLQLNDSLSAQLGQAAAVAKTAGAKSAALAAKSQLDQQAIPIAQNLQMRQAMMQLANNPGGQSPQAIEHMIGYMRAANPAMAKDMEERYVPGVGLAATPVPPDVRGKIAAHNQMDMQVRDLANWAKSHSTMVPGTPEYNVGQQKALALQSAVREGQLGTVYKAGEQPLLDKFINSNPAGMFKTLKTLPQLNELLGSNSRQLNALKQSYGLPAAQSQAPQGGGNQDQAAMTWAKANPKDPRSAAILKRLGK